MGTVIDLDLDDSKPWDFTRVVPAALTAAAPCALSPHKTLLPPALATAESRDRVQHAHFMVLTHASKVLEAIDQLCRQGFVPLGFTAHVAEPPTVLVEVPAPGLVDRRRDLCAGAVRGVNHVWFMQDGIRVAWHFQLPTDPTDFPEAA